MPSVRLNPSAVCAACVLALLCLLAQARAAEPQPHWAFQPVRKPTVPSFPKEVISKGVISNQSSGATNRTLSLITNYSPVDAFLGQKLAAQKLTFSPPADQIGRAHV